jgi:hypothetical protein
MILCLVKGKERKGKERKKRRRNNFAAKKSPRICILVVGWGAWARPSDLTMDEMPQCK